MRFSYETIDVFTDLPFGGNQLAVFPDARRISDSSLQAIARELNLSETAFAYPLARSNEWRLRIFTPAMELPFAGHPTIGTALVLARRLSSRVGLPTTFILHESVGSVRVSIENVSARDVKATFAVPTVPEERPAAERIHLAEVLSIDIDDICEGAWRPRALSCGVPFQFVCLRSLSAVRRVRVMQEVWNDRLANSWAPHLYVFTRETEQSDVSIHARMFAPAMGIYEDPATGGAAAALAGFLAAAEPHRMGRHVWHIEQGLEMKRASKVELGATLDRGIAAAITIGGSGVFVGRGYLDLPEAAHHTPAPFDGEMTFVSSLPRLEPELSDTWTLFGEEHS